MSTPVPVPAQSAGVVERRRSQRFVGEVQQLIVRGLNQEEQAFQEETVAFSASLHGALIALVANVAVGQRVILTNPQNRAETDGKIARLAQPYCGLPQVAVEFDRPSTDFWSAGPNSPSPSMGQKE